MQSALLIIGNEILSGRTQDTNMHWLAGELGALGIPVREARVVPDVEAEIIAAVNALRARYDYVFTTGGIGPTHDDITTAAVARAFGVKVVRHAEAEALLRAHYAPEQLNAARLKMADIPEGAWLINNPVSSAPGFALGNVYVMAGVPSIMRAMFDAVRLTLKGGKPVLSRSVSAYVTEGIIAEALAGVQAAHPEVEIGSYPFIRGGRLGVSLVARGTDAQALMQAESALRAMLLSYSEEVETA